jgi:hypothetical protein
LEKSFGAAQVSEQCIMLHGELGEREVGRGRAEGDVLDWIRIA